MNGVPNLAGLWLAAGGPGGPGPMGGAGPMGGGQDTAPGAADPTAATVTMTPESLPWLIRLDKYVERILACRRMRDR